MEDDRPAFGQREVCLIQLGQRQVASPDDLFPGMLIGLTNVDQDRPLIEEALGVKRTYSGNRHG
jgi:hypothetical protein